MEVDYNELNKEALQLIYKIRGPLVKTDGPGLIILLHGVGSNEDDLFAFANRLPADMVVVSARAPYPAGQGRYAWFYVDFSSGTPAIDPAQAEESRQALNVFTTQLIQRYGIDAAKVYMGGFSQGGIMSYSTGLTDPAKFAGIFVLSGRLLPHVKPLIKTGPVLQRLRVFIAHGKLDPVLPVMYAHEAKAYLDDLVHGITYHEYNIGHTVNEAELEDLNSWLTASID